MSCIYAHTHNKIHSDLTCHWQNCKVRDWRHEGTLRRKRYSYSKTGDYV